MNKENVDFWIEKLLNYYNISTPSGLAIKLNTTPQNISKWKTRNSISAIKKKCRELGIYNEIFENEHNVFKNAVIDNGRTGVDNSVGKKVIVHKQDPQKDNSLVSYIPDFLIDELGLLFKRCPDDKKNQLVEIVDEFISNQKRNYR